MPTLASRMLLAAALVFSCLSATSGLSLSPITRVVELLNGISAKIEEEAKAEESLYETFVCWAKSITSQKTKSNTAASSRIQELTTYIADLDAGRVELTTERADLTKEMEEITADIESATAMRNKEQQDYEDAKEEMEQAIEALTAAVSVLKEATEGHKTGSLLAVESGFEARKKETESLNRAISMSERVLTKADAGFLRRLLTGEVPTWDWKKLNRKATFKMDYKARSFKIQEVLAKLLENFASDLKEATAKEEQAVALYDKLMESKGAEKAATSAALAKMEKETGARGMSRAESVEEVDTLTTQVENDKTYIDEVTTALEQKKTEWKERQALRTGELAAISKAIEILHSDDARDLFKKSFASQAKSVSLLQVSSSTSTRANEALMVLKGMTSQDARLAQLVSRLESGSHFKEVIEAIDKMLDVLSKDMATDLTKKEACESDRATDTREASLLSRSMDDLTDAVDSATTKIAELTAEIDAKTEDVANLNAELKSATALREEEHTEWVATDKDDKDALALVNQAKVVLEQFYIDNNMAFVQKRQAPFTSVAGEAPPPPPSTWETPYGGKQEEQQGVTSLLAIIAEDIEKDIAKSLAEEQAAEALYQQTKADILASVEALEASIESLSGLRGETVEAKEAAITDRSSKNLELKAVMDRIAAAMPDCDYFTINYPLRVQNRQTEIDGLNKAKDILGGGQFTAANEDRAIVPGDALVQRRSKFLGRTQAAL